MNSFEGTVIADAKRAAIDVEEAVKRAVAGIEAWYADHFHRAITTGATPIPSSEKAALTAAVKGAISPSQE